MTESACDIAVFGSTPMAGLLAGLLAVEHGRRVCLVAEPWSPYRLPRGYQLGMAPVTRPETWALLRPLTAETVRLLTGIGKGLVERVDPLSVAEMPDSIAALSHVRHMAAAHGHEAERLAERTLTDAGMVLRVRDVVALVEARAAPAIAAWAEAGGVRLLRPDAVAAALRRDGSVRLTGRKDVLEARQVILADDAAILALLDPDERDRVLHQRQVTAVLSEPAGPLPAPIVNFLDRDVTLVQRARGEGILAFAGGPEAEALVRIGASLGGAAPLRRAAQASFRSLVTTDGAPLVGTAKGTRARLVAGFGPLGAFFAPALARHFAGTASASERSWFAARQASRGNARQQVADFVLPEPPAVAA